MDREYIYPWNRGGGSRPEEVEPIGTRHWNGVTETQPTLEDSLVDIEVRVKALEDELKRLYSADEKCNNAEHSETVLTDVAAELGMEYEDFIKQCNNYTGDND